MNELESQVLSFSEADFNRLFDSPEPVQITPPANNNPQDQDTPKPPLPDIKPEGSIDDSQILPLDNLDDIIGSEGTDTETVETIDDDGNTVTEPSSVNELYKDLTDKLIEAGIWTDYEERESTTFNHKKFQQLAIQQEKLRVEEKFNDLIESTGDYGKSIINFIMDGGDPDEIIDLFKEERTIESFEPEDDNDKANFIASYYKNQLGWKPEKISKYIKNLEADDEVDSEVVHIKDLYKDINKAKIEQRQQEARIQREEAERQEEEYRSKITTEIRKQADLTETQKRSISDALLSYDQPLPDGRVVNKFYLKVSEIQSNPTEYIDLVRFVMDKENYLKDLSRKVKNETVDNDFKLLGRTKGAPADRSKPANPSGFTFKQLYK